MLSQPYTGGGILKDVKNKAVLCKPLTMTKATYCKPHMQSKLLQTGTQLSITLWEVVVQTVQHIIFHTVVSLSLGWPLTSVSVSRWGWRGEEGVHSRAHPCTCVRTRPHEPLRPDYTHAHHTTRPGKKRPGLHGTNRIVPKVQIQ